MVHFDGDEAVKGCGGMLGGDGGEEAEGGNDGVEDA